MRRWKLLPERRKEFYNPKCSKCSNARLTTLGTGLVVRENKLTTELLREKNSNRARPQDRQSRRAPPRDKDLSACRWTSTAHM